MAEPTIRPLMLLLGLVLAATSCGRPAGGGGGDGGGADALDPKLEDADGPDGADGSGSDEGDADLLAGGPLATLVRVEDSRRLSRPLFARLLEDPDVVVRRRALLALGRMRRSEGLAPLRSGLTDEDETARRMALFGLGQLEASAHADAERVILSYLDLDRPPGERRAAIMALGQVGTASSRGVLMEALESPDASLRATAARALGIHAMRQRPPAEPPFPELVPRLGDGEQEVRLAAVFALSRGAPPPAAAAAAVSSALERAMRTDEDPEVRVMAARALSRVGFTRPGTAVTSIERDEDWRVRAMAASALARAERPSAVARAIKATWGRVRDDRAALLGPDVQPLVALLEGAAEHPHRGHGRALKAVHREAGARATKAETDRERLALSSLRCLAALAMDRARGEPRLVKRCAPEGSGIEPWQLRVLEARAWKSSASATANRRLGRLLRDDEVRVRLAAIETIGTLPGEGRLPLITRALRDKSPHVVAVAAHELFDAAELFEIEEQPTQNLTVTEHTASGPVVHNLTEGGVERPPVPVKRVVAALKLVDPDQHPETAINLAKVVGRIRIEKAADVVRPLARHHSPAIRKEGRRALERLGIDPGPEIAPDPPRLVSPAEVERLATGDPVDVEVETTAGTFVIRLRGDLSPATAVSFLSLVRRGFYDGITFHRVVPGFVAQVGDPTGTGYGGPGYTVRCEVTLFGEVTRGMEVVDSLQQWDRILHARVAGETPPAPPAASPDAGPSKS